MRPSLGLSLSPLRRLCSLVVSLAVLSSAAAADHADASAGGRSGGRADAHPHRADEDAAPPVYLVTGATGRTGSLVYFGLQAAVAAQVVADELGGAYADPNHPGCARSVVALSAGAAVVSGADAAADGRSCDGATDVKWGPLAAALDSDAIVVDFSPKGGPADLRGVFDPSVPGIQWADGNVWTKLDGRRHGRSATDGRTAPAVRALVTDLDAAREVLGCTACDASEGIYLGDVTEPDTLDPATDGVTALAIAVGVGGNATEDVMEAVEFRGVQNQVASLAASARKRGAALTSLNVALISSMGTTDPNPAPYEGGEVLFYKLNAEAFLGASGVPAAVIKPCGLGDGEGSEQQLLTGHDDTMLTSVHPPVVARADVARVMVQALVERQSGLRFDLCASLRGPPTTDGDLDALLDGARWGWQA